MASNPGPPPPRPSNDEPDYGTPAWHQWKAVADRWRQWNAQQDDWIRGELETGKQLGELVNPATGEPFQNAKEKGMSEWSQWGPGGLKSTYGDINVNAEYDWAGGQKRSRGKFPVWEPIEQWEWDEYNRAQGIKQQMGDSAGIAEQLRAQRFQQDVKNGHFTWDPQVGAFVNPGNTTNPDKRTWQHFDQYGRPLNDAAAKTLGGSAKVVGRGAPPPSGAGGISAFGGGFGGGSGSEMGTRMTGGGAETDLMKAMARAMDLDAAGQQFQLMKGYEGYGRANPIYDFLQNEVYGPVLGVQFQSGKADPSALFGERNTPDSSGISGLGPLPTNPQERAPWYPDVKNPVFEKYEPPDYRPEDPTGSMAERIAIMKAQIRDLGTGTDPGTLQAKASMEQALRQMEEEFRKTGGDADIQPFAGYREEPNGPSYQGDQSTYSPQMNQEIGGDFLGETVPYGGDQREGTLGISGVSDSSTSTPQKMYAQAAPTQAGQVVGTRATGATTAGGSGAAAAPSLPRGSYSMPGVSALDPNMNKTWARFAAPTWNKIAEAGDSEIEAIERMVPRGGEQAGAISDAIRGRYGALQGAWQGMVPQALAGLSGMAQEHYFQQPSPQSGALGTMANYQSNLEGLKAQTGAANKQASAAKWQGVGSAVGGLLSGDGGSGLKSLGKGLLTAGSMVLPFLSDERSKEDIEPFNEDLDDVRGTQPVKYKYNEKAGAASGKRGVSVIAQKQKKVQPEAVDEMPDGMLGVKPMEMLMSTINAVKALDKKVSSLTRGKKGGK